MTCWLFIVAYFKTQDVKVYYRANVGERKQNQNLWQAKWTTVCITLFSGAFKNFLKSDWLLRTYVCVSARTSEGTNWSILTKFNISGFSKICRNISSFVKMCQELWMLRLMIYAHLWQHPKSNWILQLGSMYICDNILRIMDTSLDDPCISVTSSQE